MGSILIINIKELFGVEQTPYLKIGKELGVVNSIKDAFLFIKDGIIDSYGSMNSMNSSFLDMAANRDPHKNFDVLDAKGKFVIPSFCDSHTHIVYAGSREQEFTDKIKGLSYQEIAKRGGGILNSSNLLHNSSEDDLYNSAMERIREIVAMGTGAVEIKSGYGLSPDDELKMLRVIKRIKETSAISVKSTFLGAHAYPQKYIHNKGGYVDEIINVMIPMIAAEDLADYIDVFCEEGFFSVEDTDRILNAGMKYGMRAKVHANQMGLSGGIQVGVKYNAISVDHLENCGDLEIDCLKNSNTIATLLPGATFFLNMAYAPARSIIDAGVPVALATNYNPGSCPSGSMQFQMALCSIALKMTPYESFNACTINGAYAMGLEDDLGSITKGKKGNVVITKEIPSLDFIPYAFTSPFIFKTILNGEIINNKC